MVSGSLKPLQTPKNPLNFCYQEFRGFSMSSFFYHTAQTLLNQYTDRNLCKPKTIHLFGVLQRFQPKLFFINRIISIVIFVSSRKINAELFEFTIQMRTLQTHFLRHATHIFVLHDEYDIQNNGVPILRAIHAMAG